MSFDPSINPEQYVIWEHRNSTDVMGPANLGDGACFGRERICTCSNLENALRIAALLTLQARRE